jgi:hypothetical protein
MIPIRKIKYKDTLSYNKICNGMNATDKIIYLNRVISRVYSFDEKQGVTSMHPYFIGRRKLSNGGRERASVSMSDHA